MNKIYFEVTPRITTTTDFNDPLVVWDAKVWQRLKGVSGKGMCLFSQIYLTREDAISAARREALKHKKAKSLEETLERPYVEEV